MPSSFGTRPQIEIQRILGGGGAFLIPRLWRSIAARVLFGSFGAGSCRKTHLDKAGMEFASRQSPRSLA